jgi:hypothetical protein
MGRELGFYGRCSAASLFVESVEIFRHCPRDIGWIDCNRIPFILTTGALLLDIGPPLGRLLRNRLPGNGSGWH